MWRLLSAVTLTAAWVIGLFATFAPGVASIEEGLSSGKRIALAQYAWAQAENEAP